MSLRQSRLTPAALFALAVLCGVCVVLRPIVPAALALSACSIFFLSLLVRFVAAPYNSDRYRSLQRWALAAFVLHLSVGVVVTLLTSASTYLGPDAAQYHARAVAITESWRGIRSLPVIAPGKEGFYYLLAGLYSVFGPEKIVGLIVNAALGAALVPLVSDTTRRLFGIEAARRVPPLALLLPSLLLWPSQLLREAGILFFLAVAANCGTRLRERTTPLTIVFLILSVTLLFTFRGYIALVVGLALIAGVVVSRREAVAGVGVGISISAVLAFAVFTLGVGYSGYKATVETDLATANEIRSSSTEAASGFDPDADVSTARRAVTYLPIGLLRVGLGPFPWEVRSVRQLPALADALSIWILSPALIAGLRVARDRRARSFAVLLLPGSAVAVTVALVVGNFGTIVRSRTQVLVLILPFFAAGLAKRSLRRRAGPAAVRSELAGHR